MDFPITDAGELTEFGRNLRSWREFPLSWQKNAGLFRSGAFSRPHNEHKLSEELFFSLHILMT